MAYAHRHGKRVLMALNTFADARDPGPWTRAVDRAVALGADALICSPPSAVRWQETPQGVQSRLNGVVIDSCAHDKARGYPAPCKGRYTVQGQREYATEEPTSLNTLDILPELIAMGVKAIKIEGRQRSAAYVEQVTQVWRTAIDSAAKSALAYSVQPGWTAALARHAEGQQHTLGAYNRPWR